MKITISIVFLILFSFPLLQAQSVRIEGKLVTAPKNSPLSGGHVSLISETNPSDITRTITDSTGSFIFTNISHGTYRVEAFYLGYEKVTKPVSVSTQDVKLGVMTMVEQAIPQNEVVIEEEGVRSVQKGDTTEYTAQSFKVNKDANAEDLVTKMPGVTVENGTVKAQGENVQQVLVDGRQFFGNDPTLALKNMPAEVIDKIQVFDKMSDQAQFTGFDDGRSVKTMNIVTRADRRQGQFGKFNAGYGTESRYVTSGNLSNFSNNMRLSVLAMSNNVNQQNFATQDLLGVMSGGFSGRGGGFDRGGRGGRGGGGGMFFGGQTGNFLVGQQSGTSYTHSLGINYSDSLASNLYASGSYFFNLTDNENPQSLSREYTLSQDSSSYYNEGSNSERKNYNHRFNIRGEYSIDTSNTLIVTPQISFQDNKSGNVVIGSNTLSSAALLSKTEYRSETKTNGYSSDNRIVYRHRFPEPGRTVSVDFGYGKNRRESDASLLSQNVYYSNSSVVTDTIDQKSNSLTEGYSLSSSVSYTEPISTTGQLQVNYSPSYSNNSSEKFTYDYDPAASAYSLQNFQLSNSYENAYTTHNAGLSYRHRDESFNFSVGTSYQVATLKSERVYPYTFSLSKSFYSLLPNLMVNYELPQRQGLRFFYRTSTNAPSVNQLQDVIDNSNPLFLSTGNPDLKQSFTHTLLTRLSLSNAASVQSILIFLTFNITRDYIANSTFIAQKDTVLPNNITLNRGSQLTMPINIDGYWSARTFATYGFPIDFIKSNLNVNAGFTYSRTPGLVSDETNIANVYAISPGFVLGSNISEEVDFTLNYSANFNTSHNSVRSELDNNYFTHTAGFRFTWNFLEGFVFRNELNNSLYDGLSGSLNQNVWLWNLSIGKKLFENDRGEITFSAVDLLNQNKSISRTITETYIEDSQTQPLQRYFLLTFTYTLREFGRGDEQRDRGPRESWRDH